jgi:alpha-glucosidase
VGDLRGILRRLDHLERLGIRALWLSPIFPSPMKDFGYDVADYTAVDPLFGTMDDFDALLAQAHARSLKIILDIVPNHTSDQHAWFRQSRSDRTNPRRDWYIWADPAPDGGSPNNWLSFFGGPAWSFDEQTGQYYLHQFLREQPELNYRNPAVLAAMLEQMRFWLDKGVDGFRVDVIWLLIKDALLRDEPPNPRWRPGEPPIYSLDHIHTQDQPEVHAIIRAMRSLLAEYGGGPDEERVLIGEIYLPNEPLMAYYGSFDAHGRGDECHLPFNFQLIGAPWQAQTIRAMVDAYEGALPPFGWPNWVIGNHDQRRIASRVGPEQARVAAMLLLTLRGTPTVYYGDEIGMRDVAVPPARMRDPQALNQPELAEQIGRDPERAPMPWDASPHAGFTVADAEPWLPLPADYAQDNVAAQEAEPGSMLQLHRALAQLRAASPALAAGSYRALESGHADAFAFLRECPASPHGPAERLLVLLNFSDAPLTLDLATPLAALEPQGHGPARFSTAPASPADQQHHLAPAAAGSRPPASAPTTPTATLILDTRVVRSGSVSLHAAALAPHQGILLRLSS